MFIYQNVGLRDGQRDGYGQLLPHSPLSNLHVRCDSGEDKLIPKKLQTAIMHQSLSCGQTLAVTVLHTS